MTNELRDAFAFLMLIVFVFILAIFEFIDRLRGKEPPYTLREVLGCESDG